MKKAGNRLLHVVYLLVVVTVATSMYLLCTAVTSEVRAAARASEMYSIGREWLDATDRQVTSARQYARFGDPADLDRYIRGINWPGADVLMARAENSGANREEMRLLRRAHQITGEIETSRSLAVALLVAGRPDTSLAIPASLRETALTARHQEMSPEQKVATARSILGSRSLSQHERQLAENLSDTQRRALKQAETDIRASWDELIAAMLLLVGALILVPFALRIDHNRRQLEESRVKTLIALSDRLSGAKTTREAGELALEAAQSMIGWDASFLHLYDAEADELRPVIAYDTIGGTKCLIPNLSIKKSELADKVIQEGPQLVLRRPEDIKHIETSRFGSLRPSASLILVPVHKGGRVIGIMSVQSYRFAAYTQRELDDMVWLSERCAAALERASLHDQLHASEERYRALLENSLDGVYVVVEGRLRYCNDALAQILGFSSASELQGKDVLELSAPEAREKVSDLVSGRAVFGAGSLIIPAARRDGSVVQCEVIGRKINYDGSPAILGTVREVSERERARQELDRVHEVYRHAIEALSAAPYILDIPANTYNFLGADIKRLTGFSASELTPLFLSSRIEQAQRTDHSTATCEQPDSELDRIRVDLKVLHASGKSVWLADASIPRFDEQKKCVGSFGILMDITERKRAEERAKAFASLGARLSGVTTAVSAARIIAETADSLFGYDSCAVNLYDEQTRQRTTIYIQDIFEGERRELPCISEVTELGSIAKAALKEPQLILRERGDEHLKDLESFGNSGRRSASLMFAPMRSSGESIGYLSFQSYSFDAYTIEDLEDLQFLADHCAAGLLRAKLYEEILQNEEQFRAVWERAGSGMRLTDADGIIRMVNPAFCKLVGLSRQELEGRPFNICFEERGREAGLRRYRERFRDRCVQDVLQRSMALWDGRQITFKLSNAFLPTVRGVMLLSIFSDLTAEKKLNEELQRYAAELERLAITDSLTGLFNRREFVKRFATEVSRAQRYGSPISLLMIDVDHFKLVNDSYGHPVGDRVLARVAEIIQQNARFTDVACRYGGEEFCICMPETSLDGAHAFADRLRCAVSDEPFSAAGQNFSVTCSIGVVELDATMETSTQFLSAADAALYRAKEAGRDRVSV